MQSMKHTLAFVLALAVVLSLSATALAATPSSQEMQVEYTVPSNYGSILRK